MPDHKPKPNLDTVKQWLTSHLSEQVESVNEVSGGFWSSAFSYVRGEREYILRLSESPEGFAADAGAMQFACNSLPIPRVIETGEALGAYFALSDRHYGKFLESSPVDQAHEIESTLAFLFASLRAANTNLDGKVNWFETESAHKITWHDWLLSGITDNADKHVSGWREKIAANRQVNQIFDDCETAIDRYLPACPERRDLIHGDLLHQNVLISEDAKTVTGIFSWKCSALGDFLYDVAWCTFWGDAWFPTLGKTDLWSRTLSAPDLSSSDLVDAAARHHCYELQIAASHLGWFTWTDDKKGLSAVMSTLERVLARGPL